MSVDLVSLLIALFVEAVVLLVPLALAGLAVIAGVALFVTRRSSP